MPKKTYKEQLIKSLKQQYFIGRGQLSILNGYCAKLNPLVEENFSRLMGNLNNAYKKARQFKNGYDTITKSIEGLGGDETTLTQHLSKLTEPENQYINRVIISKIQLELDEFKKEVNFITSLLDLSESKNLSLEKVKSTLEQSRETSGAAASVETSDIDDVDLDQKISSVNKIIDSKKYEGQELEEIITQLEKEKKILFKSAADKQLAKHENEIVEAKTTFADLKQKAAEYCENLEKIFPTVIISRSIMVGKFINTMIKDALQNLDTSQPINLNELLNDLLPNIEMKYNQFVSTFDYSEALFATFAFNKEEFYSCDEYALQTSLQAFRLAKGCISDIVTEARWLNSKITELSDSDIDFIQKTNFESVTISDIDQLINAIIQFVTLQMDLLYIASIKIKLLNDKVEAGVVDEVQAAKIEVAKCDLRKDLMSRQEPLTINTQQEKDLLMEILKKFPLLILSSSLKIIDNTEEDIDILSFIDRNRQLYQKAQDDIISSLDSHDSDMKQIIDPNIAEVILGYIEDAQPIENLQVCGLNSSAACTEATTKFTGEESAAAGGSFAG